MGVQVIQLTSKSHHENILASLHQLLLQGELSDVTVQVDYHGDVQEFQAHQVMLAASSGYFKKILLSQEAPRDKLLLSDMNFNEFAKFMEFVYTGRVEVARDKIGDVQAVAEFLDCRDLSEVCGEAMSVGIHRKPAKKASASEAADKDVAKTQKGTKGKKTQLKSSLMKRQLAQQSPEREATSKRRKAKNIVLDKKRQGRKLKLKLPGRKKIETCLNTERGDFDAGNQAANEYAEEDEDMLEAEAQPETEAEERHESATTKPVSDTDDGEFDGEEQSNDAEEFRLSLEEEEDDDDEDEEEEEDEGEEGEEEEEEGEEGQSKETLKRTSKAQFQCDKCQRTFHYERSYLKHISTYHGVKADVIIYRCDTCLQTFANRSNLKIHEKHVHSTERLFSCDACTKTFKRKKDVVRHQRQVHERNNTRHVCLECGKALSSKTALVLHERTHTGAKPFSCTDCGARFTQNSALKMHHRIHTGEKPFACDECDARFTQKHMLSYHKRSHTGERPFMCEACGKSFASKEYLRHHSNIHTGSRPYKCDKCGRGFAQRNSLHQHLKIHTGERPYSCKDCDKQFTQLNALQRHQRIHTGEKPYMCGLCRRTFTDKSTLRRHTMIHDSDAPWKTYLVVLEGNVEDKKPKTPTKGKTEKAAAATAAVAGEKKSCGKKGGAPAAEDAGAAAAAAATDPGDTGAAGAASSPVKAESIMVPTEPVTLPSDWAAHGAIALVSHSSLGGITVIHTEVPAGTQIQPLVTTDSTGASVISLDGSAIPVPFSIPVSMAHPIPLSEASSIALSGSALSLPVSDGTLASVSEIPTVSTSSVLEAAASQTILAPASQTKAASNTGILESDILSVIVGDAVGGSERQAAGQRGAAAEEPTAGPKEDPAPV